MKRLTKKTVASIQSQLFFNEEGLWSGVDKKGNRFLLEHSSSSTLTTAITP